MVGKILYYTEIMSLWGLPKDYITTFLHCLKMKFDKQEITSVRLNN